ncbi:MAG TPA: serine hydrolase domain-containing protein [Myxococcus sp.]|nr:serine hydrolase domain-containing protein [Myxococcus sp.]
MGASGGRTDVVVYWENNAWRYGGVYRAGSGAQRLVIGDSWTSFINTWEDASAVGLRLMTLKSHQAPSWRRELDKALEGAMGYSYAIVEGGAVTASGGVGYARSPSESTLPGQLMSSVTRVHLASVSKSITAVALMELTERYPDVDLDDPFYPLVQAKYPTAGSGVANVTLRQLLTHRSGMPVKGYCGDNFHAEMSSLVASNLVTTPGGAAQYSNGNYCLVRSVIESVSGMAYVDFVKTYVLAPMGITGMSCQPSTTLYYAKNSSSAGYFWNNDYTSQCGAYGWYGSANDLAKFLVGVRNHTVLSSSTTSIMNDGRIGWWGNDTSGGVALHHNGAWVTGDGRGCNTGIMRLPNGVEAVVLSNTHGFNTIGMMLTGYEAGPYSAE